MGICYVAQEAQPGTPHQPGGVGLGGIYEGGLGGRGYMYTYG